MKGMHFGQQRNKKISKQGVEGHKKFTSQREKESAAYGNGADNAN
jgi:hypothetical protein